MGRCFTGKAVLFACAQTENCSNVVEITASMETLPIGGSGSGCGSRRRSAWQRSLPGFCRAVKTIAALPANPAESSLLPENNDIQPNILTYHSPSGAVISGGVHGKTQDVPTVNRKTSRVDGMGEIPEAAIKENEANVTSAYFWH